jgi:hypothetical protein
MKTKIIILLLAFASSAEASLIDLTPGGFSPFDPPKAYLDWQQHHFGRDSFGIAFNHINNPGDGWNTQFLGSPFFNVTPLGVTTATLSWDLTGTRFIFNYLFVGGPDGWINMYRVPLDEQKIGESVVTINDLYAISGIGIYGFPRLHTPDTGTTLLLFALALAVGLVLYKNVKEKTKQMAVNQDS